MGNNTVLQYASGDIRKLSGKEKTMLLVDQGKSIIIYARNEFWEGQSK